MIRYFSRIMAAANVSTVFHEKIISRFVFLFVTCFIFKVFHSRLNGGRLFEEICAYYTVQVNTFEHYIMRLLDI